MCQLTHSKCGSADKFREQSIFSPEKHLLLSPVFFFLKDLISPCDNERCIEFDGIKALERCRVLSLKQQLDCVRQRNMLVGFVRCS